MYEDRTDENIKQEMLDMIDADVLKMAGTFTNDILSPSSIKQAEIYMELSYLATKLDIETLEGEELEMIINQRTGIKRRQATKAKGQVTFKGDIGAIIDKGTIISNRLVQYETLEEVVIGEDGTVSVNIQCLEEGSNGNALANTITEFTVAIPGITEVYNENDILEGYDAETDDSLLQRYYEYVRIPATSGNVYHYIHWAKEVEGVGDVKVTPIWQGMNTVKVTIIDDKMKPANEKLVNKVQEHIDPNSEGLGYGSAPLGAKCTVVSAKSEIINLDVNIKRDTSYTLEEVQENIFQSIEDYFKTIGLKQREVSYAKIGAAILDANGIIDYSDLLVNGDTSNIILADEEVPIFGEVVIHE